MTEPRQASDEQLIEHMVRQITRWNLVQPALLFLEAGKPFSFLASQGLFLCEPLLGYVNGEQRLTDYARLFADRSTVDRLIARLEQDPSAGGSAAKEKNWEKR